MTSKQQQVLEYILKRGRVTTAELAKAFNLGRATARTHAFALSRLGEIRCTGMGPGSAWVPVREIPDPIHACPSIWTYAERLA